MKKLSKFLTVSMMAGFFLTACGDGEDMDEDFPGIEEPADPEFEEDMEEDMDDETDDELDNDTGDDIDG